MALFASKRRRLPGAAGQVVDAERNTALRQFIPGIHYIYVWRLNDV
jgi:hypothetical protein